MAEHTAHRTISSLSQLAMSSSVLPDELTRLFQIWKTVIQMLRDRGYLISADLNLDKAGFTEKYSDPATGLVEREKIIMLQRKKDDPSAYIFVFWPEDAKVGVDTIRKYFARMKRQSVNNAIIIVGSKLTPYAKQTVTEAQPLKMETFLEEELLVNITEHHLVPKHEVLSSEDKARLLKRYALKDTQLPRMLIDDPVARYFGLEKGQVVKIVRPSETAGRYVTYRLVC